MKIIAYSFVTLAAVASAAAADSNRRLEDIDIDQITGTVCAACNVCDAVGEVCDVGLISDIACDAAVCELLGGELFCAACTICADNEELCDTSGILDICVDICDGGDGGGDGGGGGICFSEIATVQVLGASSATAMKDLELGDQVLTSTGTYETIYAFGHRNPTKPAQFFQIFHSENTDRPLEVTPDHLVFLQGKNSPVPARTIQVGDVLMLADTSSGGGKVLKIGSVQRNGIYAPITTGGTLLVDGVAASSYVHLATNTEDSSKLMSDHDLIHMTLSPYRMLCRGVSATFCDTRYYNEDGMPHYAHYGMELLKWLIDSNSKVGLSAVLFVTGACHLLEGIFGCASPLMVFLGVTAVLATTRRTKSNKAKAL